MRLGTRGSTLALAQAKLVADRLQLRDGEHVEIVAITTSGDRAGDGDKARWIDALEQALLDGQIDLAVHSAKDLPGELSAGLVLLGGPARAAPEDVLCGAPSLGALAPGARVGTSSLRRAAQLRAARADLEVVALAGNVDTRLRRLASGQVDAIVLARAGLQRLGCEHEIGAVLDRSRFVPAPGQGMLALQARVDDSRALDATGGLAAGGLDAAPALDASRAPDAAGGLEAAGTLIDREASACLCAERALARALGASCDTPLGALAAPAGCGCLLLRAWLGLPDGSAWVADELLGGFYDPEALGARVAERMLAAGAGELLAGVGRAASRAG